MIKTITIKTEGESTEKEFFEAIKRWLIENLQDFTLEVSGRKETLNYKLETEKK